MKQDTVIKEISDSKGQRDTKHKVVVVVVDDGDDDDDANVRPHSNL